MKLPILVLAFNRADHVEQAMKAIREYKPDRLYLECDGARPHKSGEKEAVEATRKMMLDMVDWPCEVKTLFREENLGCANAVYGAISWFFENEEYGCIIEDDVVVSQDFFRLCEELLPRYKNEDKIMQISARNHEPHNMEFNTYMYSCDFHCWGWASWRRAWNKMDMQMKLWPSIGWWKMFKMFGLLRGYMMHKSFDYIYNNPDKSTSWATRWFFAIFVNKGLMIVPGNNLALNVGMDGGAHYEAGDEDPYAYLELGNLEWPLVYNDIIRLNKDIVNRGNRDFRHVRIVGIKKKIRKLIRR